MRLTPGGRLGRYEITAALGAGGMGEVYKAHDIQLDRDVAIKLVASSRAEQAPSGELLDEARAASRLNHPHICTIHEVFELDGRSHIVMEFVAGRLLKDCIPRDGLPTATVLAYGIQIASAIAHAHDHRIVHGDLKSANIIVTREGRLKVLDFGLARHVAVDADEERTHSRAAVSTIAGTLPYMAPELLLGERPSFGTDIWALGVVLYELTAGRLPFAAAADAELSSAILRDPPTELTRSVPTTLRSVIHRALSKDPETRYQRASELMAALDVLRVDSAIAVPSPHRRKPGNRHRRRTTVRALAVLPLDNLSSDPSQDYFVDGLTETLIAELARIRALRVTSRTSVMRYKGSTRSAPEIAAELGVDALVEGSVLRFGDRVRVTAQLIDARDDTHLWADSYDRDLRDILALQQELARAIAGEIRVLTPQAPAVRRVNPEAFESYLKGRHFWNRRTEDSMRKGLQAFSAAVALDPGYALAYVGQADSFNVLGWYGVMPPSDAFPKAKAAARLALDLDPTLAEAYTSLAYATNYYDWNWESARADFERALELNPRYALAHHWFAIQRASLGDADRALTHMALAVDLDPLSLSINAAQGLALLLVGSPDRAADRLKAALDLDPAYPLAQAWLAIANIDRNPRESLRLAERVETLAPESLALVAMAGHCRGRAGDRDGAQRILGELQRAAAERYVAPGHLAAVYSGLGEIAPALAALERAIEDRSFTLVTPKTHPMFDPLRSDARFQGLLRSAGL
jgi:serine/threonine-protein kinase